MYKDVLCQLLYAIRKRNNELAKGLCLSHQILNAKESHGWSPLIVAVYSSNYEMVKYLIEHKADINVINNNGTTLLMYAKDAGLNFDNWNVMRYLLSIGLNVCQQNFEGKTLADYINTEEMKIIPDDIIQKIFRK